MDRQPEPGLLSQASLRLAASTCQLTAQAIRRDDGVYTDGRQRLLALLPPCSQLAVCTGYSFGAILFYAGASELVGSNPVFLGGALAFCASTFLCIACADLLPELQFHSHDRLKLSMALAAGLGVAVLIGQFESSGHDSHQSPGPQARAASWPSVIKAGDQLAGSHDVALVHQHFGQPSRPPVPKSQFKGCYVVCRMQKSEAAEIAAAAKITKQEKSVWMREVLLRAARAVTAAEPKAPAISEGKGENSSP